MSPAMQLLLFTAKVFILSFFIILILVAFFSLIAKGKSKIKGKLTIKNLNRKYAENAELILAEVLTKKNFKHFLSTQKKQDKEKAADENQKNIYVLNFIGDIKASALASLREEVTAILSAAKPSDEVVVRLESAGGMVHAYGLAAAQLMRIRARGIPLTISIDKIAASGGYMMACIANKIIAAPFAIIGSIGVVIQLPNFHRLLKDKHIDYEMHTAGEFKRTITLFGENTKEGREKLNQELEDIHRLFKNLIAEHRPHLDINRVATGEHWLGQQALSLNLIDSIETSDEYLMDASKLANVYEITYEIKKSFFSKFNNGADTLLQSITTRPNTLLK